MVPLRAGLSLEAERRALKAWRLLLPLGGSLGETSELTIPRNLRGRFRGFVRVGGVPERAFQHFKIALSTLNLGVSFMIHFVS